MINHPNIEIENSNYFIWSIVCIFIILALVFVLKQRQGVQVNTKTMHDFVLKESKQQVSPIKKYFPAPYSVKDIAKE
ncbi:MAG: hypothetical protein J5594_00715 [Elusimicrobiaceae bacterium]|nr:hypothetical protein [Elusimicrobiaceae bacterium]